MLWLGRGGCYWYPLRMRVAAFAMVALFGCGDGCSGCGGEPNQSSPDLAVIAEPPDLGPPDLGTPDLGPSVPSSCVEAAEALSAELAAGEAVCTVAVRLAYETRELLGYQVICGPRRPVSEVAARATGEADTGVAGERALHPGSPEDAFVFVDPPSDFGGVAVVSARTGLTDFGGGIVWSGTGEITYPAGWREPDELHEGCAADFEVPARGYDLAGLTDLEQEHVDAALEVVRETAIGAAFAHGGTLFDAVVLRYPRRVGVFMPSRAEWIVLLHGGQAD